MARLIAQPMQKALGQPVIVDNKPGASCNLAAVDVIKSPGRRAALHAGQPLYH